MANGTLGVSQIDVLTKNGTGTLSIVPPDTNTNRTLTLPDATTTIVGTNATQTLTNKTLGSGLVMGASAITSGTSKASTSGTSIDFTGIPSWVKRITVMFNGVSLNSTSSFLIQLGTSSGVDATSYVSTSVIARDGATSTGLTSTTGCVMTVAGAASLVYGTLQIVNISGNTWVFSSAYAISGTTQTGCAGGNKTLSGTLDQVRITTVNGTDTFDAGSINILYE